MHGCFRFFILIFTGFAVSCASAPEAARAPSSSGPMEHALWKLREKNASEEFLTILQKEYREDERLKVLDLNILGFLRSRPDRSGAIPGWELKRVEGFIWKHRKLFRAVEKKYAVPKEVIASLLWVETKYGRDIGTFHVASSYLSLAQADYPTIIDQTLQLAQERAQEMNGDIEAKVIERSKKKSEWAVEEILALQEIHEKGYKDVVTLEGSFSGAFGLPQFIPSSYISWAKGKGKPANLFKARDAIESVANYLVENGWKKRSKESQQEALFHYNRDRDYVNRILRMSDCLKSPAKIRKWKGKSRRTASARSC